VAHFFADFFVILTALSAEWFHRAHLSSPTIEQYWFPRIHKHRSDEWQCINPYPYLALAKILISTVVEK